MSDTPSCRLCGSADSQTLRAEHVFGGAPHHRCWECPHCEVVYLHPAPTPEEDAHFYAREFEKFMQDRSGSDRDWSNAERHVRTNQDQVKRRWRFLEPYLKPGRELLEIGCSSGFMLQAFREAGLRTCGVEPSGTFLEYVRGQDFEVYENLDNVPADRQFDLVVSFFVFEHMRDPREYVRQQLARLRPGGVLVAEMPCVLDPLTSVYTIPAFERFYWCIPHHFHHSPRSLEVVLQDLPVTWRVEPDQRYDLSNHMVWMTEGRPGGQGRFNHLFSAETLESYKRDLIKAWRCDTIFLFVEKP